MVHIDDDDVRLLGDPSVIYPPISDHSRLYHTMYLLHGL